MSSDSKGAASNTLERVVGVPGAVLMGLGSILGTGAFVSLGLIAIGLVWHRVAGAVRRRAPRG